MTGIESTAELLAANYAQHIETVVARLRAVADQVERDGRVHANLRDVRPDFLASVRHVQHAVIWGVASLHLDDLVQVAWQAHLAAREEGATTRAT